ncbi:MAG: hypothetical protein ACKOAG_06100, partial [Candidatus Kapaibacterium sp.]
RDAPAEGDTADEEDDSDKHDGTDADFRLPNLFVRSHGEPVVLMSGVGERFETTTGHKKSPEKFQGFRVLRDRMDAALGLDART